MQIKKRHSSDWHQQIQKCTARCGDDNTKKSCTQLGFGCCLSVFCFKEYTNNKGQRNISIQLIFQKHWWGSHSNNFTSHKSTEQQGWGQRVKIIFFQNNFSLTLVGNVKKSREGVKENSQWLPRCSENPTALPQHKDDITNNNNRIYSFIFNVLIFGTAFTCNDDNY